MYHFKIILKNLAVNDTTQTKSLLKTKYIKVVCFTLSCISAVYFSLSYFTLHMNFIEKNKHDFVALCHFIRQIPDKDDVI